LADLPVCEAVEAARPARRGAGSRSWRRGGPPILPLREVAGRLLSGAGGSGRSRELADRPGARRGGSSFLVTERPSYAPGGRVSARRRPFPQQAVAKRAPFVSRGARPRPGFPGRWGAATA